MDQREIVIKQNIEGTRTAIDDKLETIERRIHAKMQRTKSAIDSVTGSIHLVKSILRGKETRQETTSVMNNSVGTIMHALDGTVERIKYTTELIGQVKQNSWIILESGVLVGYVMGRVNREESLGMRRAHVPANSVPGLRAQPQPRGASEMSSRRRYSRPRAPTRPASSPIKKSSDQPWRR